jgi:prevent-host-death family protein
MSDVTTVEARKSFSEIVNRAAYGKERVRLMRRGKALAVLVPVEDAEAIEALEDAKDAAAARKVLRAIRTKRERLVPWEKLKADLGL